MDAVGRPTDCFAVAQLIVLGHCGDCHSGDAAAWSVPLRAPRPVGSANHRENGPDPAHLISTFQKTLRTHEKPTSSAILSVEASTEASSRMALGRSAGDMRTRRAGARACRQQLEEAQRQQRKRLPLEHSSRTLQTKLVKSKTRERWTSVSRQKPNSSALHANDRVVEAQSIVNPSSSHLLCNCRRHRARLGSMASRIYLLFGRSIARPLFAPLGFASMLV